MWEVKYARQNGSIDFMWYGGLTSGEDVEWRFRCLSDVGLIPISLRQIRRMPVEREYLAMRSEANREQAGIRSSPTAGTAARMKSESMRPPRKMIGRIREELSIMNEYQEMMDRQQQEVNALPLGFAFGQKQFDEMMRSWGLHPERDIKKIYSIGAGSYIQKKDAELLRQMSAQHRQELTAAVKADTTGDGFIFQMFYYELASHEYGYTGEAEDALDALGYTLEQVQADQRLCRGFERACKKIMKEDA